MSYTYQVTVDAGDAYIDQRPTAEGYTVYSSGTVDTETPGNYVITYTFIKLKPAFDTYTENKLVTVNNSTPVITLLGDANKYISIDSIYADDGATTNLGTLETVFPAGGIDTTRGGSYSIMYVARHKGFTSFATRTVHVLGQGGGVIDLKPAVGLDILNIEILAPSKPEIGLNILNIENLEPSKPEVGLDIAQIVIVTIPQDGPRNLEGEIIYPEINEGFGLTGINTWLLGTPEEGYSLQSIEGDEYGSSEKGYSITNIEHKEFGSPEEGYSVTNVESSELGIPKEGYGVLLVHRYKVAVANPVEGIDVVSIEAAPVVGLNISSVGLLPASGLDINSVGLLPEAGLDATNIGVLPDVGLDITAAEVNFSDYHHVELNSTVSLEMNWVWSGTFTMGSPETEEGRNANRETQHEVTLTQGFYLGKYEVTQAQYEAVMTGNDEGLSPTPSGFSGNPNRPVERVSWDDIQVFLRRLNEQQADNIHEGWEYSLPTEAQWEYACRAGTSTAYSWGDTIASDDANYNWDGEYNTGVDFKQTLDVGQYDPNPWGFFDMHGNVLEWTQDWYQAFGSGAVTDPRGAATGEFRVRRGGSWITSGAEYLRSAYRQGDTPDTRGDALGFRIVYVQKTVPAFGLDIAAIEESPAAGLDITAIETEPAVGLDITGIGEILSLGSDYDAELSSTVSLGMIWVDPGTFTMGSPETEAGGSLYIEPQHEITFTTGFFLGKYEVTQAQYQAVMEGNTDGLSATPSWRSSRPNHPVESVTWYDIQVFLNRLNEQQAAYLPDGWEYALPTEAQWEYACRAGTTTAYSFGDTITPEDASYKVTETTNGAPEVGQYAPNPWGFYDMHGNVWEWTADAYFLNSLEDATDPYYPGGTDSWRTVRGGSFGDEDVTKLRSAKRSYWEPDYKFYHLGFRVALRQIST